MKWIKYQIVQSTIGDEVILITKKVGHNEANLAIAEAEAYNGEYEIIEDEVSYEKEPLAIEFGGTGAKTLEEARENLGISNICKKASGEVIVATDSDEAKPLGFEIDGKSEQNQYSGSQLFDVNDKMSVDSLYSVDEDGWISLSLDNTNGTVTKFCNFYINPSDLLVESTNYLLVTEVQNITNCDLYAVSKNDTNNPSQFTNIIKISSAGTTLQTIRTNESFESALTMTRTYVQISKGVSASCKFRISILADTTVTADTFVYEPFVGGIPSPNQSYPQEIRNIGVYDEASGKYAVEVKCTGKNLFNIDAPTKAGYIISPDGSFTENNGFFSYRFPLVDDVTVSYVKESAFDVFRFGYEKNGVITRDTNQSGSFTVYKNNANALWISINKNAQSNIQVEYGTVATPYELYEETTATVLLDEPLRGIDGYKDNAYISNGKLKVVRKTKEEVLTGGFTLSANSGAFINDDNSAITIDATNQMVLRGAMSERYIPRTWHVIAQEKQEGIGLRWGKGFGVRDSRFSTADEFNAHIAENPLKVQFILAEPITEEIDLSLDGLSMFYPTTILSNDCNANMEVTYLENNEDAKYVAGINKKVEQCFQSVSDGKALVASAITDKRVQTDATATFAKMAENIMKIVLGSGNATAGDVLAGKTFTNDDGVEYTGTLALTGNAAAENVLSGKTFYNIDPKNAVTGSMANIKGIDEAIESNYVQNGVSGTGIYARMNAGAHVNLAGSGYPELYIPQGQVATMFGATATAADITQGKTVWVNGVKITGTRPAPVNYLTGSVSLPEQVGVKQKTQTVRVTFSKVFDRVPTINLTYDNGSATVSNVGVDGFAITHTSSYSSDWKTVVIYWTATA